MSMLQELKAISRIGAFRCAILICIVFFVFVSQGAIRKASSCSLSDVKAALASASSGDIVSLPAGSATWSSPLSIDKEKITIQGNGIGSTIISGNGMLFTTSGEKANNLRITGVELQYCKQCIYEYGSGSPRQALKNFRFDHCKFVNAYIVLETNGGATGVIDHCVFLNSYAARLYGSNDASATFPYKLGTSDAIYVENNTVTVTSKGTPPHFIASNSGSRYVVRYNTFDYGKSLWDIVDAHGFCEVNGRGSATWEIYNNTFNLVPTIDRVIHLRGGQGVVFNNTFNNYKPRIPITITDYAGSGASCVSSAKCSAYPCKDQINHAYFWNNTSGSNPATLNNNCTSMIKEGRDFYTTPMPDYVPYTFPHPLASSGEKPITAAITQKSNTEMFFTVTPKQSSSSMEISYSLMENAPVHIAIYNMNGALVKRLVDKKESSGNHSITWNSAISSKGVYLIKADIGNSHYTQRLIK